MAKETRFIKFGIFIALKVVFMDRLSEQLDNAYRLKLREYHTIIIGMNLPADSIKEHLEKGEFPECISKTIKYGVEEKLSFNLDEFPFLLSFDNPKLAAAHCFDRLTDGLEIGYDIIPSLTLKVDSQVYKYLMLDEAIINLIEEIPDAFTFAKTGDEQDPVEIVANLLMYAAEVQYKSDIDFCE